MQAYLTPLMADDGELTVASEPGEAIELLGKQSPLKWGVALVWHGYKGPPDSDCPDWQDHTFSAFVRVPTGLPAVPGDALIHQIQSAGDSVIERIEWVSVAIRRIQFSGSDDLDNRPPRLEGSAWFVHEDKKPLRIHELRFVYTAGLDEAADMAVVNVA